jgi:ATP-binding cassette, subfamily B, bacterial MsbA
MIFKQFSSVRVLLKATNFWQNNSLILREFKHFPKIALLALLFSLLAAAFEGIGLGFLLSFLQSLTSPDAAPLKTGVNWFDVWILGVNTSATSRLYRISALIWLSTCTRALFNYLAQIYTEFSQLNLTDRLRKQIFEQLQAVSLSYFSTSKSGELINTITSEIERFRQIFNGSSFLFTRGLAIIVYLVSMFLISWQLTIMSFMLFSLMAVGLSTLNKRVREGSFEVSTANGHFATTAIELIGGMRTVRAFTTQDFERRRYYQSSDNIVSSSARMVGLWAMVKPLAEAIATTILITMILIAFNGSLTNGSLQVSSLLTFLFILVRLVPFIQDVNGTVAVLSSLHGSAEKIKELLRTDNKTYFQNGKIEFPGLKHSIELIDVDFSYDGERLILKNITLSIERGQVTALVGSSGAGKTTLVDLIPRFYDPNAGRVSIDGIDLRQIEINSFRRKLAVVSQDTFIFNTSVRNNIAYGTENATDREIKKVAQLANALEFIQDMPQGFDTILGDRGIRLSGGQRQRIAIARALLRDPEILILDEATSALDSVTERLIQDSLETLSKGRTVIVIAHRLSTITKADRVVVMDRGQIVEQGTYLELLTQRGRFWTYHQMQNDKTLAG